MTKKDDTPYAGAMKELREALLRMQEKAPGQPCVEVPLDKVFYYNGKDGDPQAVMPVQEVIYLVDQILRG